MDWDTWFFEVHERSENAGSEPGMNDYQDYLFDRADLALGEE